MTTSIGRKPSSTIPVVTVILAIIMIWYAGAINLNSPQIIDRYEKGYRLEFYPISNR